MFTGMVEELGIVRAVRRGRASFVLSIGARRILSDLRIGDSVAVNGVCPSWVKRVPFLLLQFKTTYSRIAM